MLNSELLPLIPSKMNSVIINKMVMKKPFKRIKTIAQIERRIKWICKEINTINKEFHETEKEETKQYLTRQISMHLDQFRELKWCSGINYDKFIN